MDWKCAYHILYCLHYLQSGAIFTCFYYPSRELSTYFKRPFMGRGTLNCGHAWNLQSLSFKFYIVTGNANFNMAQTSFTLLGFMQLHTAMPIIEDTQNNAKGFTSRFLWFFPEPVFCQVRDTVLTDEETSKVVAFKKEIGRYHTTFYHPIYKRI